MEYEAFGGYRRKDVTVNLDWSLEGDMIPRQIYWADGRVFDLAVADVCHRPAEKVGNCGVRYTVKVYHEGRYLRTTFLFFEDGATPELWFVEERVKNS